MNLKLRYDAEFDLLHWGREGIEDAAVEIYPGVTLELDASGVVIGVEVFKAGQLLGPAFQPLLQAAAQDSLPLPDYPNYPAALTALLQSDGLGGYREYLDCPPADPMPLHQLRQALEPLRQKFPAETQLPA